MLALTQHIRLPTLSGADYVHDVAYDYYGTRLAMCTSGLRILIYSWNGAIGDEATDSGEGEWIKEGTLERAHAGPIWRLSWGHPEHGEPLASCSEDHTVNIYYRRRGALAATSAAAKSAESTGGWFKRAQLASLEGPVVDVRFAPAALGFKVAAITADGLARIFECVNSLDGRTWEEDQESPGARLQSTPSLAPKPATPEVADKVASGCSSAALDWMPYTFGGASEADCTEVLAVGGRGGRLAIWEKEKSGRWKEVAGAEAHPLKGGGIKDVAWCPNICRPYEIIATCGAGAALWRVDFNVQEERYAGVYARKEGVKKVQLQLLRQLVKDTDLDTCPVWRCSWNLTGTNLALCPESGQVSVWKADASLEWRQECEVALQGSG